jgi:hypothetical protein
MIDRKTALASAALIALMLAAAVWRIVLDGGTALAVRNDAALRLLFLFPACSALLAGALYIDGRGVRADDIKVKPWRKWARSLSITYCVGLLLVEGMLIVRSLGLDMPFDLSPIESTACIVLAVMCLQAVNQMPKLPWFERKFAPGGDLGPVYGPRYMRTVSRILAVFMIAVIAFSLAAPPALTWRSAPCILVATALLVLWSIALRFQLGRKAKSEQLRARGTMS